MTTTAELEIRNKLLGAWRLVSWQQVQDGGTVVYPLGADAAGQLIYSAVDRVSAQLVRTKQAPFASDDWQQATAEEMCEAWPSYFGYFGTFSIDLEQGAVIHHIEGSWFPNLVGSEQVRSFSFEGDRLVLHADTAWGAVRIVWDKV
jgi:Lipocalin-like domain